jgi:hypothetical protein
MVKALQAAACVLALAGTSVCSAAPAASHSAQTDRPAPNRLTAASREVRLALPARPASASVIVLRVAEIKNPTQAPLSLDTALAPCPDSGKTWEPERLASLGIYPPDRAGTYTVPVTAGLGRLRSQGISDLKGVCLQVRMQLLQRRDPEGPLEVTLASPDWRDDSPK